MSNAVKTVAKALEKSVAGDSVTKVKTSFSPHADVGGGTVQTEYTGTETVGPFTFDYSKLEDLRKAFNEKDQTKLAELLPDSTTFAYREEIAEEELQKMAKESVDKKYAPSEQNTELSADKQLNSLSQELKKATEQSVDDFLKAQNSYYNDVESVKDKTVRQGINRSSVYDGMMERLNTTLAEEQARIEKDLASVTENVKTKMEYVETERTIALKEYDLKKAEEYDKRLQSLRSEEYAARKEIIAYNKKVSEWKNGLDEVRLQYAEQILVNAAKNGLYVH